jgi:hypothetical protein
LRITSQSRGAYNTFKNFGTPVAKGPSFTGWGGKVSSTVWRPAGPLTQILRATTLRPPNLPPEKRRTIVS